MTTVQIAYEVNNAAFKKIEDLLQQKTLHDVNWSGTQFNIERDDFTCIADDDSADAVSLLIEIQNIIND